MSLTACVEMSGLRDLKTRDSSSSEIVPSPFLSHFLKVSSTSSRASCFMAAFMSSGPLRVR
eukprot:CAMPEP_0197933594 /NCGR_PEP_ID=MMETSP1439-20131203/110402_1 /TAXON_ID=66791 /ORGANISM="Gonyaulax spinifera, Strain CCMP409" /LENGTH=60 /DNA_ID=CAMNT_0043556427 /DNA_START=76 /DNA_END=255 /DNA_ORIENTATION=+